MTSKVFTQALALDCAIKMAEKFRKTAESTFGEFSSEHNEMNFGRFLDQDVLLIFRKHLSALSEEITETFNNL